MKIDPKTLVIIVLSIALLLCTDGCGYFSKRELQTKTTTVIDTVYVTQTDTSNTGNTTSTTKDQDVLIADDDITQVDSGRKLTPEEKENGDTIKKVRKLTDVSNLENGTITSEILFTGEILKTNYRLDTEMPIITETKETIIYIPESGSFAYAGSTFGVTGNIQALELGLQYSHKNKAFISGGLNYLVNPFLDIAPAHRLGLTVKIGIRL